MDRYSKVEDLLTLSTELALNSVHSHSFTVAMHALEQCWENNDLLSLREASKKVMWNLGQMKAHIEESLQEEDMRLSQTRTSSDYG